MQDPFEIHLLKPALAYWLSVDFDDETEGGLLNRTIDGLNIVQAVRMDSITFGVVQDVRVAVPPQRWAY